MNDVQDSYFFDKTLTRNCSASWIISEFSLSFHWCKVLCAALGKFLQPSGITEALINSGVFGKGVAESSFMKGGDYVQSREGMNIISEAITILQYEAFLKSDVFLEEKCDEAQIETLDSLREVKRMLYRRQDSGFVEAWELSKIPADRINMAFKKFLLSSEHNESFFYRNRYQQDLHPILRDFELSVRKGDWALFVSAVRRSLNPFFSGSRSNYSRYGYIFHEDCLDLQRKFPMLYKHFAEERGFVCYLTEQCASGIGFDQGLEKVYNFTSKAVGGIIGVTRQKKSVALWDLIKFDQSTGELNSLHHEFSAKAALESSKRVAMLVEYIKSIKSPFGSGVNDKLINIVTKEEVENSGYYLNFVSFGDELYKKFVQERFEEKSVSLYNATISSKYYTNDPYTESDKKKAPKPMIASDETENSRSIKYIQYMQWKEGKQ